MIIEDGSLIHKFFPLAESIPISVTFVYDIKGLKCHIFDFQTMALKNIVTTIFQNSAVLFRQMYWCVFFKCKIRAIFQTMENINDK